MDAPATPWPFATSHTPILFETTGNHESTVRRHDQRINRTGAVPVDRCANVPRPDIPNLDVAVGRPGDERLAVRRECDCIDSCALVFDGGQGILALLQVPDSSVDTARRRNFPSGVIVRELTRACGIVWALPGSMSHSFTSFHTAGQDKSLAVGSKRHRGIVRCQLRPIQYLIGFEVPDLDDMISPGRYEKPAVRCHGDHVDEALVPAQDTFFLFLSGEVDEVNQQLSASRDNFAVGRCAKACYGRERYPAL